MAAAQQLPPAVEQVLGLILLAAFALVITAVLCKALPGWKIVIIPVMFALTLGAARAGAADLPKGHGKAPKVHWSAEAKRDIPSTYRTLYTRAGATCKGVTAQHLAAVGKIETNHGRCRARGCRSGWNRAGAAGPMQFGIGKGKAGNAWAAYGKGGDVYDPADAISAAARKLCHDTRGQGDPCPKVLGGPAIHRALKRYNNACWYVDGVVRQAKRYGA